MKTKQYDLVIVGGGIMGLMTAYYASEFTQNILLIEKRTIGNKYASSAGISRSFRNDYLDPDYNLLSIESKKLWKEIEQKTQSNFFINCGLVNLANKSVTPDVKKTYAYMSCNIMKSLGLPVELLKKKELSQFPQFSADIAAYDSEAGLLYIPAINKVLLQILKKRNVTIKERTSVESINENEDRVILRLKNNSSIVARNVVMTAGVWSLELLGKMKKYNISKLPIFPHKQHLWYYMPKDKEQFEAKNMPVFAYLDVGIYGHPLCNGAPGIKVAYFDPFGAKLAKSGLTLLKQTKITDARSFLKKCIPGLKDAEMVKKEYGYYQMTLDNEFIVGKLDGYNRISIGVGFCGTGYKFAPIIGKALAQLAFRGSTVYDINRFNPKRFGRLGNGSIIKILPMLMRFLYPGYWGYVWDGFKMLLSPKLP